VGKWSQKLHTLFKNRDRSPLPKSESTVIQLKPEYPSVRVSGPFAATSQGVLKYRNVMLIASGIGITPFVSIVKHIWHQIQSGNPLIVQKIYFYWMSPTQKFFKWFSSLLACLQEDTEFFELNIFLTSRSTGVMAFGANLLMSQQNIGNKGDIITGLKCQTSIGRPNFEDIFTHIRTVCRERKIGVFVCGPQPMCNDIKKLCHSFSAIVNQYNTRFDYHQEYF
jgi:NADPH oxidase